MASPGIDAALAEVSNALQARIDEIMDAIAIRLREDVPELDAAGQPEMWEPWRESTRANLECAFAALRTDREPPNRAPPPAAENARESARAGTPLPVLLSTYRVGQAVVWDYWLEEVETRIASAPVRRTVLQVGSRFMFRYIERLAALVSREYTEEHERSMRRRDRDRAQAVRDLLAGASEAATDLGYALGGRHVGLVAWGERGERSIRALGGRAGAETLIVPITSQTAWGWLAVRDTRAMRALGDFAPLDGTAVAIGELQEGLDGFRLTHRQARLAHAVALTRPRAVTRYDDVALEALAMQDEILAREFAATELAAISGGGLRDRRLRETLRSYFAASQNAAATAAALGVHERTVANRLRSIEERLGRPVGSRSAELETALRLRALFDETELRAEEGAAYRA